MKHSLMILILLFASSALAYSIPGVSNQQFKYNDTIQLSVLQLESLQTMIPYAFDDYYHFIKTEEIDVTLAEQLLGQHKLLIQDISFKFGVNKNCTSFQSVTLSEKDVTQFTYLIDNAYTYDLLVDNLPAINNQTLLGPAVGEKVEVDGTNKYFIYNHLKFTIEYNQKNIVGFYVEPSAVGFFYKGSTVVSSCGNEIPNDDSVQSFEQKFEKGKDIIFTYEVSFVENLSKTQASRWDIYKSKENESVHWNNILCSFGVNLSLSTLIYFLLRRILNRDFSNYQQVNQTEEEDMGWKQLKCDVFRPPGNPIVLSSLIGIGVQVAVMTTLTVFFIALYYLAEQYRTEKVLESFIVLYVITGLVSGYYSARFYKMMSGAYWIRSTLLTSVLLPGIVTLVFIEVEFSFLLEDSSNVVGFGAIFKLFFMWFGIQIPLTFLGSIIGFKRPKLEAGCSINPVPQYIPPQPKFLSRHFLCIIGGILPFGTILMELQFIMNSVWTHSFYHLFGFIFLALILLMITSAEISILLTYLQLNNGNHKWWWNSFYSSGFCGVYIFAYGFFYWLFNLQLVEVSSTIMYFGIMGIVSFGMFLLCGSVGFISSYAFIKFIYSQIKAD